LTIRAKYEDRRVAGYDQAGWRDYVALMKPGVISLVSFTGLCGMLAARVPIDPILGLTALLSICVAAGASGAFNQWYERDTDALMQRTANRPLPSKRIHPDDALAFAIILAGCSVMVMGLATNWLASALLVVSIFYYCGIYTVWLKKRSAQNIVVGGAAGAFPPVIGWIAVTGEGGLLPWLMFALIFMWTPPHFWSLSLYMRNDYARAGIPMLPVVAGRKATRLSILMYSCFLVPISLLPWWFGLTGLLYGLTAIGMSGLFLFGAWRVAYSTDLIHARRLFLFSISYLFVLCSALALDRILL